MATQLVADLGNAKFRKFIIEIGLVVHSVVPELNRFTGNNMVGFHPHTLIFVFQKLGICIFCIQRKLVSDMRLLMI